LECGAFLWSAAPCRRFGIPGDAQADNDQAGAVNVALRLFMSAGE
jgi:hypothetical protein